MNLKAKVGLDTTGFDAGLKRMKAKAGGNAPPEFLSTHPSNDTRIENLTQWAPLAKQEAQKFGVTSFQ